MDSGRDGGKMGAGREDGNWERMMGTKRDAGNRERRWEVGIVYTTLYILLLRGMLVRSGDVDCM